MTGDPFCRRVLNLTTGPDMVAEWCTGQHGDRYWLPFDATVPPAVRTSQAAGWWHTLVRIVAGNSERWFLPAPGCRP